MNNVKLLKEWRRGQDSNLHSLSAGGFQDRCTTIMRPLHTFGAKEYNASGDCGKTAGKVRVSPL
jgi:hypothetical protein